MEALSAAGMRGNGRPYHESARAIPNDRPVIAAERNPDHTEKPSMANQNDDRGRMTGAIDKAKAMGASDLPKGHDAAAEADRTKRAVDNMATGNTPHGADDPQHGAGNPMMPDANQTGGRGGKP